MLKIALLIISFIAYFPNAENAIMEAMIHIDSDSFRMTSFLQRFKRFIAKSHDEDSLEYGDNTWVKKFVHHNDTFQVNYDFSRNQLTMESNYSLLLNGSERKVSDVKITINFRFNQDSGEKYILQNVIDGSEMPQIGNGTSRLEDHIYGPAPEEFKSQINDFTILDRLLSPIVDVVEPIIVTFIHIIVNGVLGHALTSAFDQLYNGRLITI